MISIADREWESRDYLWTFIFGFGLLIITLNAFVNIVIIQRYFPEKLIPLAFRRLHTILLIISSLLTIALVILCMLSIKEVFGTNYGTSTPKITFLLTVFYSLLLIITLVMQAQLPGQINRNNRKKMESLIDSIGE
jgi:hypothetical protein